MPKLLQRSSIMKSYHIQSQMILAVSALYFLHTTFKTMQGSFLLFFLLFQQNSTIQADPSLRVLFCETCEYLNGQMQHLLCLLYLVSHQKMSEIIAICFSIRIVVFSHLFLSCLYGLLEYLFENTFIFSIVNFCLYLQNICNH